MVRNIARTKKLARVYDEYLVASARAGERAALERLVKHWQVRLLAHAYRLTGDVEQAKDVAQDAWADIIKGLPKLRETSVFPAWAYRIVTRKAADHIRRAQRKRRTEAAYSDELRVVNDTALDQEPYINSAPLSRAIQKLPPQQRAAIALFYLQDLSITEISVALEVPAGTVKTRLMHARNKLRAILEGYENG
jgi:RNA polymerase sigma-70 factor (ECF subfamily)